MSQGVKNIVEQLGEQRFDLSWKFPDQHPEGDLGQGYGGLALDANGQHIGIKNNQYRLAHNRVIEGVFVDDTYSMQGLTHVMGDIRRTGIEIEACVYDADSGEIVDLKSQYGDSHGGLWSPELYKHTIEVQSETSISVSTAMSSLVRQFVSTYKILGDEAMVDPSAACMGHIPDLESDRTDHPYVDVMIEALSKHGGQIQDFVGHGMHQHVEVSAEQAHDIARYMQILAPIISAGMTASPFMHGKTSPNLYEIFQNVEGAELIRDADSVSPGFWNDVRNIARIYGSSSGGVGYFTQSTMEDVLRHGDEMARDGRVTTVSRGHGMHSDVRIRYDMPHDTSTVELCYMDNPIGSEQVIGAYAALNYAVVEKLSWYLTSGEDEMDQLHTDFESLFGKRLAPEEMTSVFDQVMRNNIQVSKHGRAAKIEVVTDGRLASISQLMEEVLRFTGMGITESQRSLIRSTINGPASRNFAEFYKNPSGTGSEIMRHNFGHVENLESGWNIDFMKIYRNYILNRYEHVK
ncbi:MAG: glutamate-cysteine ligase family protein [bacterium]|nr:glutamate-cysteine ligase family protein [bacterium]